MKITYVKCTQKAYPLSFKLEVVWKIEQGELVGNHAKNKYGIEGEATIRNWLKK